MPIDFSLLAAVRNPLRAYVYAGQSLSQFHVYSEALLEECCYLLGRSIAMDKAVDKARPDRHDQPCLRVKDLLNMR